MTLWRRAGGLRGVGVALLVVVALRCIQLGVVALLAGPDQSVASRLLIWDGGWFINVAVDGYPSTYAYNEIGEMVGNGFAFFPLYPLLIRGVALLGLRPGDASLFVATVAGVFAGVLIYLLGVALWSRRVGLILTMLVCAQPMAVSLVMGYTEGLFLALVAGTFIAVEQRIWWLAGLLGTAAALTRPTGIAVALGLTVAVGLAWPSLQSTKEKVWAASAALASLVAGPLFLAWVGWRVGEWDAWFKVQSAGWGSTFDFGASVVQFIYDTLRGGTGMVEMVTAWLILGAVALCLVAAFDRIWTPLLVFGMVSLVLVVGQAGYWHSKPRLLVPVMLLASVPVAQALARASTRAATALLVLWSAFGLWFGAYMITIWPFTI